MASLDRLLPVFSGVTPTQARLLWGLLTGYVEDFPEWEHLASESDMAEIQEARLLLEQLDHAFATITGGV